MIGPTIIPIVNYIGSEMIVMPLIIMGVLLNFGGLASFFLPETRNKSLPQTIYDSDSVPLVNPLSLFCKRRRSVVSTTMMTKSENVQTCDVCKLEMKNANQCNSFSSWFTSRTCWAFDCFSISITIYMFKSALSLWWNWNIVKREWNINRVCVWVLDEKTNTWN